MMTAKRVPTVAERREVGKAARKRTPRSSLEGWEPTPHRPDPVGLIEALHVLLHLFHQLLPWRSTEPSARRARSAVLTVWLRTPSFERSAEAESGKGLCSNRASRRETEGS
jgi:hypothetical protein